MTKKLHKGAFFTDIHFGKKANSQLHNEDCLRFIDWFCAQVQADPSIEYVGFLGDWNENRSALNVATLNYSYQGAKKLNDLGIPVFFVVGNHDLYHRHTREVHSVVPFNEFTNFTIIDEPKIITNIADGALFSPFLFHDEYPKLAEFLKVPFWAGHFEFKGFQVTGYNVIMPTGPDPADYKGPKYIASGHFHKRQHEMNVVYIGNTFPMDFGDAGDFNRGMMIYDHVKEEMTFEDWEDCPKYTRTRLTDILDGTAKIYPQSRVKCLIDVPITFEESTYLRSKFLDDYKLREFSMEETKELQAAFKDTQTSFDPNDTKLETVDELVIQMLNDINSDHIDNGILIEQYKRLTT